MFIDDFFGPSFPQGDYFQWARREEEKIRQARIAEQQARQRQIQQQQAELAAARRRSAAQLAASKQKSAAQLAAAKAAADKQAKDAAELAATRRASFDASSTAVRRSLNILSAPQVTGTGAQTTRAAGKPGTRRSNVRARPNYGRASISRGGASGLNISV
ncbi:hypothetical protein [uncultured phage_MedDCM-OCT-S31-C1]|uniref:Uncharacterized protein n=1 Tax=uncultured phage_MedDCM-OCT-S31-C1 TaxID=2740800 RepID=A0A6S4PM97_9CAUD|nr:hypothetical protein HOQ55_gp22 [uncultured phage_MedDCM-OCT-S31-C1]BAQ94404.1 hypothetical protein [uncultured phage_MedDCM-OCT-S31-C1]